MLIFWSHYLQDTLYPSSGSNKVAALTQVILTSLALATYLEVAESRGPSFSRASETQWAMKNTHTHTHTSTYHI
jgi:hypothetical protein